MPKGNKTKDKQDIALQNFKDGYGLVDSHPLFSLMLNSASVIRDKNNLYRKDGLAFVTNDGTVICNPYIRAMSGEWARVIAHCLLHLGMSHFQKKEYPFEWNMACDYVIEKFLSELGFGNPLSGGVQPTGVSDENRLYGLLCETNDKTIYMGFGTAGAGIQDMLFGYKKRYKYGNPPEWPKLLAYGLSAAVQSAVNVASGDQKRLSDSPTVYSEAEKARRWFVSNYPLLGAIAAEFKIIYNYDVCLRMEISTAAVSPSMSEIYINPHSRLSLEEMRFVMAHEILHAALRHDARHEWRDTYLWNVACDFVINQWLTEMNIGERPEGSLYDIQFNGMSAEAVYDRIVNDMRMYRKLATLRGIGLGDIIPGELSPCQDVDLDDFYRRALAQGLSYHQAQERGYLPAGLIEEIYALAHPPISWDVELARWFDEYFTPIEKKRSYARPSRRQSSSPDIPRPNWVMSQAALDGRTFGVVLDTSGSMARNVLAVALGAIASYSISRDVPAVRVVFCDADAYDMGYMKPEDVAGRVQVKGRGGTILQPGIDLLDNTDDFPKEAPVLIITDAECDHVILHGREHAFLIPHGATLPFVPKGKVFRMG